MTCLPASRDVALPASYEAIVEALSRCERIDECQDWADKAEALVAYGKQAKDDRIMKSALRIKARAIRRAGELMRIFNAQGYRADLLSDGTVKKSQYGVGKQSGLSERQTTTAVRVAKVPEADFERQMKSKNPPTVAKLAEQGTKKRNIIDLGGIPPEDYARATELQGNLRRLAEYCGQHEAKRIAAAFKPHEVEKINQWIDEINKWVDIFVVNLKGTRNDES